MNRQRHPASVEAQNLLKGLAFLSPWLVGFCLFLVLPIVLSLYYSFCDYTLLKPPVFRGLLNYRQLASDPVFWQVLRNSFYYAMLAVPMGLVGALGMALLLNCDVRGQSVFRTIIFIPSLVPTIASAILWMWLFNTKVGLINAILARFHILGPGWLSDARWVIPAFSLMSVWGVGNTVVIFLAGLQDVPRELYEAADLDGATEFRKLWHVTLPTISPVIFFNLIMAIIAVLQTFDVPFLMTAGGPDRASYMLTYYLYDQGFTFLNMGYASAIAWIQLLLVLGLTALAFWTSRRWVHYQGK
ncbi:MAG: sugar ABC transporter permease [Planctomycetota bacterium]|nr:sugar ABC transporter permease [Planctomycetota bacterium]